MAGEDGLDDISYILKGFYENTRKSAGTCEVGQIVFSPVLETAKETFNCRRTKNGLIHPLGRDVPGAAATINRFSSQR